MRSVIQRFHGKTARPHKITVANPLTNQAAKKAQAHGFGDPSPSMTKRDNQKKQMKRGKIAEDQKHEP